MARTRSPNGTKKVGILVSILPEDMELVRAAARADNAGTVNSWIALVAVAVAKTAPVSNSQVPTSYPSE